MDRSRDRLNRLPLWLLGLLVVGPIVGLAIFYVWPFVNLLVEAVDTESITTVVGRSRTWSIVWFTTWQAIVSTLLTIVVGLVPAWVIARFEFAGRRLLLSLLTAVFVLPTVVMGAAFLALLPDSIDRTVWAVLGAHVVFNLAVVVRTVGTLWERLPADMDHAAATLGASPVVVFREITLPLIRPALTAAAAIIFLFTFTSFGVIRVLAAPGTRTIEVEVWRRATQLGQVDQAAVLALLQLAFLGVLAVWSARSARRHARALGLRPLTGPQRPRTLPGPSHGGGRGRRDGCDRDRADRRVGRQVVVVPDRVDVLGVDRPRLGRGPSRDLTRARPGGRARSTRCRPQPGPRSSRRSSAGSRAWVSRRRVEPAGCSTPDYSSRSARPP